MELRRPFGTSSKTSMEIKDMIRGKENNERKESKHPKVMRIEHLINKFDKLEQRNVMVSLQSQPETLNKSQS